MIMNDSIFRNEPGIRCLPCEDEAYVDELWFGLHKKGSAKLQNLNIDVDGDEGFLKGILPEGALGGQGLQQGLLTEGILG